MPYAQFVKGDAPLARALPPPACSWDNWSNPDMAAPKCACPQVSIALANSSFVNTFMSLSIILELTMTGTFGIGHGWYDQHQNILIIPPNTWYLQIDLHTPKYGMVGLPIPSSSNSLPRGWISRAICSPNLELTL